MFKKVLRLKLKVVGIAILALILIQLVTAYVFGYIAQTRMELQFKDFVNTPLVKVNHHEYHRGLFSSDSSTELSINSKVIGTALNLLPKNSTESVARLANTYSIKYTIHIEHGIFAGIVNGYFVPTIAYARTNVIYPENVKKLLNKFFENQPPLVIDNLIYLDKSGRYEIYSPKFSYDEAVSGVKVVWGGMDLVVKYDSDFVNFKKKLTVPLFELTAPTKGSALLKNLVFQSDSSISANKIKVGDTSLNVEQVKVEWKDQIELGIKIGDLLHTLTGISSTEFLNGIDAINPNNFTFDKVSYVSASHDKDNFFGADARISLNKVTTNGKEYGPLDLELSFDHVSSPDFALVMDKLEEISTQSDLDDDNNEKMREELIKTLKQHFGPILVKQPIIQLKRFSLKTPEGLVLISGNATTDGFVLDDMNDQKKFMQKLALDINVSVPKSILSYIFVLQMRYLLSAGNAEMDQQSSQALTKVVNILLDNQINIWLKKGYIVNTDGVLSTHMVIKSGKLYFNDKLSE